jgi:hypothetical protein
MKILLDEQIQKRMKNALQGDFQVFTLNDVGWLGYKNGILRELLNENKFTFLLTSDKNLPFQQNLNKANFSIILLDSYATAWRFHSLLVPKIQTLLDNCPPVLPKLIHIRNDDWYNTNLIERLQKLLPPDQILFL